MQVIPRSTGCDDDCCGCESTCTTETIAVPGPAGSDGAAGAAGAAGADGANAFSVTTAGFIMPAVGGVVVVTVDQNDWAVAGMVVQASDAGWFGIDAIGVGTISLENLGYTGNAAPGAVISDNQVIAPSGPEGAAGAAGAPDNASYWCRVAEAGLSAETSMAALATGYVKVTTGTGVPSTVAAVPIAEINTGAATTAQVLKPNGAGICVAGQVQDDEVEYTEVEISGTNIDWSLGRAFWKTLSAATTFTFSNTVAGKTIMVTLKQGAGTTYTAAWPAVKWTASAAPVMTTTSNAYAVYSFYKRGSDIIGTVVNNAY